jgi:hypothetical protein
MIKEMKWEKCSFEKATGLLNANGDVLPVQYTDWTSSLMAIDGNTVWNKWAVEFAGLTPVEQVEVLPDWVISDQELYFVDLTCEKKFGWATKRECKEILHRNGVQLFFTAEEALAEADKEIERNLAELNGDSVTFTHPFLAACIKYFPELDKFQGESIEITVRRLPK